MIARSLLGRLIWDYRVGGPTQADTKLEFVVGGHYWGLNHL